MALFGPKRTEGDLNDTYSTVLEEQFRPMACSSKYFGGATVGQASFRVTFYLVALFGRQKSWMIHSYIHIPLALARSEEQYRPMACLMKYFGGATVGESVGRCRMTFHIMAPFSPKQLKGSRPQIYTHSVIFLFPNLQRSILSTLGLLQCKKTSSDVVVGWQFTSVPPPPLAQYERKDTWMIHTCCHTSLVLYEKKKHGMFHQVLWCCCSGRKASWRITIHTMALFGQNQKEGDLNKNAHTAILHLCHVRAPVPTYDMFHQVLWWCCSQWEKN